MDEIGYRGRFAPSPTGPLHIGSLIAAMASYLDARCQGGEWLVRMEDLDPPREVPGAADAILQALDRFGFEWDDPVWYQSQRSEIYQASLDQLLDRGLAFTCACTRREVAQQGRPGVEGPVYPGTCRQGLPAGKRPRAVRLRVEDAILEVEDRLQGRIGQNLAAELGDFIIKRADGLFAYQLAVVVDDAAQGITHVVRGSDLLPSTPRQYQLQEYLGLPHPRYMHIPVAVNPAGEKLSKQTHATAIDPEHPLPALWRAAAFLRLTPPVSLLKATVGEFWEWACANWQYHQLAGLRKKPAPHMPAE